MVQTHEPVVKILKSRYDEYKTTINPTYNHSYSIYQLSIMGVFNMSIVYNKMNKVHRFYEVKT